MVSLSRMSTMKFESKRRIEEDIFESLKDSHVLIVAICGAGGQHIDMLKLQKEIAEISGLRLVDETLAGRAHNICTRLQYRNRKLVIFDNVWKSFKLKDIGVPVGNYCEGGKIISPYRDVCEEMEAHKVVQIEVLDEEAWRFFREIILCFW
ncbi:disease resistance protein At4g27190-like [Primulina huaijiensis]|uniref:disease resistance protein At4g27190-like n=1 Tax=Primulina huaijiensis TaxID=1492673 RepID=UPI003CC76225